MKACHRFYSQFFGMVSGASLVLQRLRQFITFNKRNLCNDETDVNIKLFSLLYFYHMIVLAENATDMQSALNSVKVYS